jgi:adenylate kinase
MAIRLLSTLILSALLAAAADPGARNVILLLGPPGSGKTTQTRNLSRKLGVPAINMAELLKKSAGWGTAGSKKIVRAQIESGELVNDETANRLMQERLLRRDAERGFILDGYPATQGQADSLAALIKERNLPAPVIVSLEVGDPVAMERMRQRGRADDEPATMERRMSEYRRESGFVLERYKGARILRIDASGTERDVWRAIEAALERR